MEAGSAVTGMRFELSLSKAELCDSYSADIMI